MPTAIFDRDGTLIVEKNYLHNPDEVEIAEGVVEGLSLLQKSGFRILVATNQAGIGRGYYTEQDMHAVNKRMEEMLALHGIKIDNVYFCPHAPTDNCLCRKPAQGMMEQMRLKYAIDMKKSYMIGDKESDILFGKNAGMKSILVRTGYGSNTEKKMNTKADFIANTVLDTAQWILEEHNI